VGPLPVSPLTFGRMESGDKLQVADELQVPDGAGESGGLPPVPESFRVECVLGGRDWE
jgi:hypothetical protein